MSRSDDEADAMAGPPTGRPLRYLPRDVGQASWSSPGEWGEIDAAFLEGTRLAVPAFPLDLLPPFWRAWLGDTARAADAPVDYVALSLLAAVAGLGGAGAVVRVGARWA